MKSPAATETGATPDGEVVRGTEAPARAAEQDRDGVVDPLANARSGSEPESKLPTATAPEVAPTGKPWVENVGAALAPGASTTIPMIADRGCDRGGPAP